MNPSINIIGIFICKEVARGPHKRMHVGHHYIPYGSSNGYFPSNVDRFPHFDILRSASCTNVTCFKTNCQTIAILVGHRSNFTNDTIRKISISVMREHFFQIPQANPSLFETLTSCCCSYRIFFFETVIIAVAEP